MKLTFKKSLYKKRWVKEIEESKKYEEFVGFVKLKFENEKLNKLVEQSQKDIQEKEKEYILELAKRTSFEEIKKLDWVKELEGKLNKLQKEAEESKEKNQSEKENLKKNIEGLNFKLSEAYTSDKVEELNRVKELKKELKESKEKNELLIKQAQPEIQVLKKTIEELKEKNFRLQSSTEVEKLDRVKELKEQVDKYHKEIETTE